MTYDKGIQLISLIISGLTLLGFGVIMKNFGTDRRERKIQESEANKKRIKEEKQAEMREVFQQEIAPIKDTLINVEEKMKKNNDGTVTLLRDRMKACSDRCECRGGASKTDKANGMELYKSYTALGGNHFKEYVNQGKLTMENLPDENHKPNDQQQ